MLISSGYGCRPCQVSGGQDSAHFAAVGSSGAASTVTGASIPPYHTWVAASTGLGAVVSVVPATRRIVSTRLAVMAAWAAKPYPAVRIVATRIVKPRINSSDVVSRRRANPDCTLQVVRRTKGRKGCTRVALNGFRTVAPRAR